MKQLLKGYTFVIVSAILFGLMPFLATHIYQDGVNSVTLVFLRNLFSLPFLALLAWRTEGTLKINPKAFPKISLIALMGCSITPLLLFSSYSYIPSGTATVLHFIYPAVVVLGEFICFKSKRNYAHLLGVLLCVTGIAFFYNPSSEMNPVGSIYALLSGVTYAIYIILLAAFRYRKIPAFTFSFYIVTISSVVMLLVCLFTNQLALPHTAFGWLLSVFFAIVVNVGAVVLFQRGTFLIGGSRASILSTFEPITSILAGALLLHETINLFTAVGTIFVIAAGILIALFDIRSSKNTDQ